MSENSCIVFTPTESEFEDFNGYLQQILSNHPGLGICKIIPPKSWNLREYDLNIISQSLSQPSSSSSLWYQQKLHFIKDGVYSIDYQSYQPITSINQCQEWSEKNKYSSSSYKDREKKYWKSLNGGQNMADPLSNKSISASLFPLEDDTNRNNSSKTWNFNRMYKQNRGIENIPAVKIPPQISIGTWRASIPYKIDELDTLSINYLHYGEAKSWYSIPISYRKRFESMCQNYFPLSSENISQYACLFSPNIIKKHSLEFKTAIQLPGEFIITFSGSYYSQFNHGFNISESLCLPIPSKPEKTPVLNIANGLVGNQLLSKKPFILTTQRTHSKLIDNTNSSDSQLLPGPYLQNANSGSGSTNNSSSAIPSSYLQPTIASELKSKKSIQRMLSRTFSESSMPNEQPHQVVGGVMVYSDDRPKLTPRSQEKETKLIESFLEQVPIVQLTKEDSLVKRNRVIEEMYRIQARSQITPEERQKLFQLALTMDAPRLARKLVADAKDQLENRQANPVGWSLTGEYPEVEDFNPLEMVRNNDNGSRPQTSNTIVATPEQEDDLFCKAFDEVERIRKRILQRASQPSPSLQPEPTFNFESYQKESNSKTLEKHSATEGSLTDLSDLISPRLPDEIVPSSSSALHLPLGGMKISPQVSRQNSVIQPQQLSHISPRNPISTSTSTATTILNQINPVGLEEKRSAYRLKPTLEPILDQSISPDHDDIGGVREMPSISALLDSHSEKSTGSQVLPLSKSTKGFSYFDPFLHPKEDVAQVKDKLTLEQQQKVLSTVEHDLMKIKHQLSQQSMDDENENDPLPPMIHQISQHSSRHLGSIALSKDDQTIHPLDQSLHNLDSLRPQTSIDLPASSNSIKLAPIKQRLSVAKVFLNSPLSDWMQLGKTLMHTDLSPIPNGVLLLSPKQQAQSNSDIQEGSSSTGNKNRRPSRFSFDPLEVEKALSNSITSEPIPEKEVSKRPAPIDVQESFKPQIVPRFSQPQLDTAMNTPLIHAIHPNTQHGHYDPFSYFKTSNPSLNGPLSLTSSQASSASPLTPSSIDMQLLTPTITMLGTQTRNPSQNSMNGSTVNSHGIASDEEAGVLYPTTSTISSTSSAGIMISPQRQTRYRLQHLDDQNPPLGDLPEEDDSVLSNPSSANASANASMSPKKQLNPLIIPSDPLNKDKDLPQFVSDPKMLGKPKESNLSSISKSMEENSSANLLSAPSQRRLVSRSVSADESNSLNNGGLPSEVAQGIQYQRSISRRLKNGLYEETNPFGSPVKKPSNTLLVPTDSLSGISTSERVTLQEQRQHSNTKMLQNSSSHLNQGHSFRTQPSISSIAPNPTTTSTAQSLLRQTSGSGSSGSAIRNVGGMLLAKDYVEMIPKPLKRTNSSGGGSMSVINPQTIQSHSEPQSSNVTPIPILPLNNSTNSKDRRSALTAALHAGDAVGKLMAELIAGSSKK